MANPDLELFQYVVYMILDRSDLDGEGMGNLFVGQAVIDQV